MALDLVRSGQYKVTGGSVKFFPSPNGVIRIVALDDSGAWIGEWSCLEQYFEQQHFDHVETFVAEKAACITMST